MIHLMYTTCSVCVDLTMYADIIYVNLQQQS